MVQAWYKHGTNMVQTWYKHGTVMVQTWYKHGTNMVQPWYKWYKHGTSWYKHGTHMVQAWYTHGTMHGRNPALRTLTSNGEGARECLRVKGFSKRRRRGPRANSQLQTTTTS